MSGDLLLYAGLGGIFLSVVLALSVVGVLTSERQQVARSMTALQRGPDPAAVAAAPFTDRVTGPARARLSGFARRFSPAGVVGTLQRRLDVAGNPPAWDPERVLAVKALALVGLAVLGGLLGLTAGPGPALVGVVVGAGAGFYLPDLLVYNAGIKRQQLMQKALPDALDLLTISVEAGLGFDAALSQVARNTPGPLAAEFFRVLQEMQIGKGRSGAFRAMGDRTDIAELKGFVTAMVQADRFGIPIADVLRVQAGEMRLKRQQRAEERAQKVPIKVLFPLVFTILPSLFVVIIGPGVLQIIESFSGV